MRLKRVKQCKHCPWKKSTNPYDIPHGYCAVKHGNLKNTIADVDNPLSTINDTEIKVMACHHSTPSNRYHCIGWLYNQLGRGNNILLRLQMLHYDNVDKIQIYGEQHKQFSDTLPH